jgi:hypothetical protein
MSSIKVLLLQNNFIEQNPANLFGKNQIAPMDSDANSLTLANSTPKRLDIYRL